jgi:RNA polymerase I specific transcription initiation factor RRN3
MTTNTGIHSNVRQYWSGVCRLAPLSRCIPSVVTEFQRLTERLGLMDCAPLLPKESPARQQRPLEIFFPFDPYLLPTSARLLDLPQTYIRWHGGRPSTLSGASPVTPNGAELDGCSSSDAETADSSASGASTFHTKLPKQEPQQEERRGAGGQGKKGKGVKESPILAFLKITYNNSPAGPPLICLFLGRRCGSSRGAPISALHKWFLCQR